MKSSPSLRTFCAGALFVVMAGVVIWRLSSGASEAPRPDGSRSLHGISPYWVRLERMGRRDRPTEGWAIALRRAYTVMRTSTERMSARLTAHTIETLGAPPDALHFGQAWYASTGHGGLWIVTGKGVACLVQAGPGAVTCGTLREFVQHGLVITVRMGRQRSRAGSKYELLGIAPDKVRSVEIQIGAAKTRAIPVRSNSYSFEANNLIQIKHLDSVELGDDPLHLGSRHIG